MADVIDGGHAYLERDQALMPYDIRGNLDRKAAAHAFCSHCASSHFLARSAATAPERTALSSVSGSPFWT